jgi:hypothetical protein
MDQEHLDVLVATTVEQDPGGAVLRARGQTRIFALRQLLRAVDIVLANRWLAPSMSTQTAFPTPVGPFGTEAVAGTTDPLKPVEGELELDALPLLDHRQRQHMIPPEHAIRGQYLALQDGEKTRLLRLDRDITHLGRGASADVRFEDHRVSRDHAIFVRHGRHYRILDNRSANGTFVNGRSIVATNLSPDDVIELGPVRFQFVEVA